MKSGFGRLSDHGNLARMERTEHQNESTTYYLKKSVKDNPAGGKGKYIMHCIVINVKTSFFPGGERRPVFVLFLGETRKSIFSLALHRMYKLRKKEYLMLKQRERHMKMKLNVQVIGKV